MLNEPPSIFYPKLNIGVYVVCSPLPKQASRSRHHGAGTSRSKDETETDGSSHRCYSPLHRSNSEDPSALPWLTNPSSYLRVMTSTSPPPASLVEQSLESESELKSLRTKRSPRIRDIVIEDYDFHPNTLTVGIGETVRFKLAGSVPTHAEHEVYGTLVSNQHICFNSPLLQVHFKNSLSKRY